jgi:hypothetical protein
VLYIPERNPVVEKQPEGWMMTRPWMVLFEQIVQILGIIITPGGIAPSDAEYLVAATNAVLTAERLIQDSATVTWDFTTPGFAIANAALANFNRRGTRAAQPLAASVTPGTLYFVTDEEVTERSNGLIWQTYSTATATAGITEISITGDILAGAAAFLGFVGRSKLQSPSDGVLTLLNAAASAFTRLQFGGTTASFPALKRSTTSLQVRLADDSGYGNFDAGAYSVGGVAGASGTGTVTAVNGIVTAVSAAATPGYASVLMLMGG